jgi:hypothetical protein
MRFARHAILAASLLASLSFSPLAAAPQDQPATSPCKCEPEMSLRNFQVALYALTWTGTMSDVACSEFVIPTSTGCEPIPQTGCEFVGQLQLVWSADGSPANSPLVIDSVVECGATDIHTSRDSGGHVISAAAFACGGCEFGAADGQ